MIRVFITGPALSGSHATATALGAITHPRFDPGRTPYGPHGGWDVFDGHGNELCIREKLQTARFYEVSDPSEADPRIRDEATFLRDAHIVVLVADSQRLRLEANLESVEKLRRSLVALGRDPASFAVVFALNKRDLDDLVPFDELETALRWVRCRHIPLIARTGAGAVDVIAAIDSLA